MSRKRFTTEEIISRLREVELELSRGCTVIARSIVSTARAVRRYSPGRAASDSQKSDEYLSTGFSTDFEFAINSGLAA